MASALVDYLSQRSDSTVFLLPAELGRTLEELFPEAESLLPSPFKIFSSDETQPPVLGFPVAECAVMKDLETKLDRWLTEEVAWQVVHDPDSKDRAQSTFTAYMNQLLKLAENALMSNLLSDYHGVFWLAHSFDLARHFSSIARRISILDVQAARTQGDTLKYRMYSKWAAETREQMTQIAAKAATILDGDEQRALQFFRLLQDDVLILTEEFVGPDLRDLRSFITGYLRRDFQSFRDSFERLRSTVTDLLQRDRTFRAALPLLGTTAEHGATVALLFDARFQAFVFDHPSAQNVLNREDREQFQLIGRRLREFAVLNQLRRGIVWMSETSDGQVVPADRQGGKYSRSTRPLDFGRPGVVDPVIHRFGLIYDIALFTETLGKIRRGGGKEEIKSYRQMLLFQRKLESIAQRHLLKFEKFLGDGAFYTTRRALRLVRAAVEIQRFYAEMKRKGFAFNRGLRIAANYGYYRLLPMKGSEASERSMEFYGPGIVELTRLTTGKATKEIAEIASFLVAHGYDPKNVEQFFAPLDRGVDVIDHKQHAREHYAYINANGTLVNEGIVASMAFLHELSHELSNEAQQLHRVRTEWGSYIAFAPAVPGVELIGVRLMGMVALKGLDYVEVGELVPFTPGEAESTPVEGPEALVTLLRQEFHQDQELVAPFLTAFDLDQREDSTAEHLIEREIVICLNSDSIDLDQDVMIGVWDPLSDDVHKPLRLPRGDFERLFAIRGDLKNGLLTLQKSDVREMYDRLAEHAATPDITLAAFREESGCDAYVIGEVVEKL